MGCIPLSRSCSGSMLAGRRHVLERNPCINETGFRCADCELSCMPGRSDFPMASGQTSVASGAPSSTSHRPAAASRCIRT
eukprot:scaffold3332_cov39-Prasinocladus_malaysianus.AAC.1